VDSGNRQYRGKFPNHFISMKTLTDLDIGYAAATIDCEGWIGIAAGTGYTRKRVPYKRFSCTVRVGTTDKNLPIWLKEKFGGGIYFRASQKQEWKDQHIWTLNSTDLKSFLEIIGPHLKNKQKQAELALEYLEKFHENDPTWRREMQKKMQALNKKGKPVTTNTLDSVKTEKIESELVRDY
jgi:hypothetical protein